MGTQTEPEKKRVWVACRATGGCQGDYAIVVLDRNLSPSGGRGSFNPDVSGKVVRYRCLTCNQTFGVTY